MFSLLWSEHCAYKHSRKLLRRLPTEGERVVMGPGENAGAVDVGNGQAIAFKVESHNHPSAVEPFEGAATGVGGILRDVFALGARPIAILDIAALRRARLRALAVPARRRGARHRPLRQLDRGGDGRRRDLLRGALRAQLPGQRDVRRDRAPGRDGARRGGRRRQRGRPDGRLDRARRDRRRLGPGLGRARRGRRGEAADGPDRRPLRGVEAARVLPRAAGAGTCWSPSRTSAPPASPPRRGRWRRPAGSGSTSTSAGCRCARPTWSRSRSWSPSRRSGCSRSSSRRRSPRCSRSARSGRPGRPRSASSRTPAQIRVLRGGRGGRRDAGRGAGRRLPAL